MHIRKTAIIVSSLLGILLGVALGISLFGSHEENTTFSRYIDKVIVFLRGGGGSPKFSRCVDNLHRMQIAKEMWADNEGKSTNDVPTWDDLRDYLADQHLNGIPICQSGGIYKLNRVGDRPTCSIGGPEHSSQ